MGFAYTHQDTRNRYLVLSNQHSVLLETAQLFPQAGVGRSNEATALLAQQP